MRIRETFEPAQFFLRVDSFSVIAEEGDYERHYVEPLRPVALLADPCSPPTPVSDLNSYRDQALSHRNSMRAIVQTLGPNSLHMRSFAQARNAYAAFLNSLPTSFCIGPSNQAAFNELRNAVSEATSVANQGTQIFEQNLERYSNGALPRLREITRRSGAVTSSTKDFSPVLAAVQDYQTFARQFQVEIWLLSARIEALANELDRALSDAERALTAAVNQIETNVEQFASLFEQQARNAEADFRHWDTEDGADGYKRYQTTYGFVESVLVPEFEQFRVPNTERIQRAVQRVRDAYQYIKGNLSSFPDFQPLPGRDEFPYQSYWVKDRRYGTRKIIDVVRAACETHKAETGNDLYVGDMQYEHGGRARPHKSHREGYDADVDPVEVGNIPNHNVALALAAAKRFLRAGATTIFYADQSVVDDANKWAKEQGIAGRLQYEADHTNHFHLRVAP